MKQPLSVKAQRLPIEFDQIAVTHVLQRSSCTGPEQLIYVEAAAQLLRAVDRVTANSPIAVMPQAAYGVNRQKLALPGQRESIMGRIRIQLPKKFPFHTDLGIRISDINYGNHLGNDAVLRLLHEARIRYLQQYGFTETDICGVGLMIADAAVVYKSQGYYGDPLRIEITTAEPGRYGCDLYYRITNQATGKEVARAQTGIVFFDYASNKLAELPEGFKRIIPVENI